MIFKITTCSHILLSFFAFPTATSSQVDRVSIRLYIGQINKMISREGYTELKSFNREERQKLWKRKSQKYFKNNSCRQAQIQPCICPYIICDSSPDQTGFERQQIISANLFAATPPKKREMVQMENIPFYNANERTCFVASMPPKVARRIATTLCESKEKNCLIHPVLPMMKLSYGTVNVVTTTIQNEEAPYLTIMAELSPYHKHNRAEISLESLIESTILLSEERCAAHLADTLPSTGKTIGCTHSLVSSEIEAEWMSNTTAVFYLSPSSEGETESELREKVLRFISGLAVRPEFATLEVFSYYYYYIF